MEPNTTADRVLSSAAVRAAIRAATRAATLTERLTLPGAGQFDAARYTANYARWQAAVGGAAALDRRIAWAGWTPEQVQTALGDDPVFADLPAWLTTFAAISEQARSLAAAPDRLPDALTPPPHRAMRLPFLELYEPFVSWADAQIAAHPAAARLTEAARDQLRWALRERLAHTGAQAVQADFWRRRLVTRPGLGLVGQRGWARHIGRGDDRPREQYQAFITEILSGGLLPLLETCPRLVRLWVTLAEQFAVTTTRFLDHLTADHADLTARLNLAPDTPIAALERDLSDPHRGGQTVFAVTFADADADSSANQRVIYKPRPLLPEAAFSGLVNWLNADGFPHPLATPWTISRADHGWMAFIDQHDCADPADVTAYFQRIGALIALLYVLQASDQHFDNVIAAGAVPVPIDLETVLLADIHPAVTDPFGQLNAAAARRFRFSVITSGLLPRGAAAAEQDLSGLAGGDALPFQRRALIWGAINTDDMTCFYDQVTLMAERRSSQAALNGQPVDARAYRGAVIAGFRAAYDRLLDRRDWLRTDAASPLLAFRELTARLVPRSTQLYYDIGQRAVTGDGAADGLAHSLVYEQLGRAYLFGDQPPLIWPLFASEIAALEQGDIPYFTYQTASTALPIGAVPIAAGFVASGWDDLQHALDQLGPADREEQITLIAAALLPAPETVPHTGELPTPLPPTPMLEPIALLSDAEAVAAAAAIGDRLADTALHSAGLVTWTHLQYTDAVNAFGLSLVGSSLYAGTAGIALFLAALGRVTGVDRYTRLALDAVRVLDAERAAPRPVDPGIGGLAGYGSHIYALTQIAALTGDAAPLAIAARAAAAITPERIAGDTVLDLIGGSAGALLGLLALAQVSGEGQWRERAIACGERLLALQAPQAVGGATWPTLDGLPLTGLSHGAAGIALALRRLGQATGDERCTAAGRAGLEYERAVFDHTAGNWPDLRRDPAGTPDPVEPRFMKAWCHGGPGIALSRLAWLSDPVVGDRARADMAAGLALAAQDDPYSADHLCCGTAGRAAILLTAAHRAGESSASAREQLSRIIQRGAAAGGYRFNAAIGRPLSTPGLFTGIAGIGWALLLLAAPDRLPNVLVLET